MTAQAQLASLSIAVKTKSRPRHLRALGKAIAKLRKTRGISREDFAAKIGLSYSNTANIETGQNWPSMPVFIRICEVLEVEVPLVG